MWNLPYQHNTPHCFAPNDFYRYILDIIKTLKDYGITKELLMECKVNVIYRAVCELANYHNHSPRWALLHHRFIPNYLVSFNYRVHFNLLPVKSKFVKFSIR